MATIDQNGMVEHGSIKKKRYVNIEHGTLSSVKAIVIHQTDAPTARHTFNAYTAGGNGAHFLIAKDGIIYQTASVKKRCYHVGRRIKSKCLTINPKTCDAEYVTRIMKLK